MKHDKRINLFGRIGAVSGTRITNDFTTVHCRNLLAYLALNADTDHSRDRLIEVLWPGKIDGSIRNRFSVTLYHLRKTLSQHDQNFVELINASRSTVSIDSSLIKIDYHEFCESITAARSTKDNKKKRAAYNSAIEVYSAPLLEQLNTNWTIVKQFESSEAFHEAAIWLALDAQNSGYSDKAKLILSKALSTEPNSEKSTELLTNWYTQESEPELAITCAKRLQNALETQGRTLSKKMYDRISELNLILTDRTRAVVFADEMTLTVLSLNEAPTKKMMRIVEHHGGRTSISKTCFLFNNPVQALEAGREILIDSPDVSVMIHTTIMAAQDAPPSICLSAHKVIQAGELLSTEASGLLLKARGIEPNIEVNRSIPMCKFI